MIARPINTLEQFCKAFTERYDIWIYDTKFIPYDGGQLLCLEAAADIMNQIFNMEEHALAALRECGLELLMAEGVEGGSIKIYAIQAVKPLAKPFISLKEYSQGYGR